MIEEQEKLLYREYHESFRRMLITGGVLVTLGFYTNGNFGNYDGNGLMSWMGFWATLVAWVFGAFSLAICFLLSAKQFSIYPDCVVVEWWYPRRKVIPFDQIERMEFWYVMGKKGLWLLWDWGDDFTFYQMAVRRVDDFAPRLEEAVNRHRFYGGQAPLSILTKASEKNKGKE